jgi:uncharacterized membrane protein
VVVVCVFESAVCAPRPQATAGAVYALVVVVVVVVVVVILTCGCCQAVLPHWCSGNACGGSCRAIVIITIVVVVAIVIVIFSVNDIVIVTRPPGGAQRGVFGKGEAAERGQEMAGARW